MTGEWIDRQEREPERSQKILVWSDEEWPVGVIAADWCVNEWVDVVDSVNLSFRYWMPAPPTPYEAT